MDADDDGDPTEPQRAERLIGRWLIPAVATVVFVRYLPTLADWMSPNPEAEDYLAGPNFSWAIALLDLGLALPATVGVCFGYRLGAGWARAGLYALTGWFALVGAAVGGMAIAMQVRDDAAMTVPQMLVMIVLVASGRARRRALCARPPSSGKNRERLASTCHRARAWCLSCSSSEVQRVDARDELVPACRALIAGPVQDAVGVAQATRRDRSRAEPSSR